MTTTRSTKGKQPKASGSKQLDTVILTTCKSLRLNEVPSKRIRVAGLSHLFRRLGTELTAVGKTCEEIADAMDA